MNVDPRQALWQHLMLGSAGEKTLGLECKLVTDNAKSHLTPDQFSISSPEMPVYRRSLKRRSSRRTSSRSSSTSRDNRSTSRVQSFPLGKSASFTRDDSDITVKNAARSRFHQTPRRSFSSDDNGDDAFDRWLGGVDKTFDSILSCNDSDSCSSDDDDEPPAYACINANRPTRQASEDPEVVRRLVESLRQQGVIARD